MAAQQDAVGADPVAHSRERLLARLALRLAHDFNNDLTVIGGQLELARRGSERLRERLDSVREAADRAGARARLVLDVGRPAAPGEPAARSTDLGSDLELLITMVGGRGVHCEVRGEAPHPPVDLDRQSILAGSLVLAALDPDADQPATGVLSLVRSPNGADLRLEIEGAATPDPAPLEALAGALDTALTITPARNGWSAHWHAPALAGEPAEPANPTPERRNDDGYALVVDDDQSVRAVFVQALRMDGFHVQEAGGAEEALGLVKREGLPAVLLTDARLRGGLGGPELARRLRAQRGDLPVLVLSGLPRSDQNDPAEDADFTWLQKPIPLAELVTAVRDALGSTAP